MADESDNEDKTEDPTQKRQDEALERGDVAALATRAFTAAFRIGLQMSAPFLVFGLVFNLGLGVLARLMPQMQV
ncbi:MAG: flagellar biosynthetic protein FliR, partial [Acetobacteraceae bacterium]|nr:flagellar biosynthetic protein FliR [Acetobacteraceae bacterium]